MSGNYTKTDIYLYDNSNPAPQMQHFQIADNENRSIIIVFAGIGDTHEISINFDGQNSCAQIVIIPLVWQSQSLDLIVKTQHSGSQSKSNVKVIGAVADHAHLNVKVTSSCDQQARDIVTEQNSSIVLLSSEAHASIMPSIQSINMNAHCKHGSSIKSFDNDQLFYLKSRGIDETKSRAILYESFLLSWVDNACADQEPVIRSYIRHIIDAALVRQEPFSGG